MPFKNRLHLIKVSLVLGLLMANESTTELLPLEVGARVMRKQRQGCRGTVKEVRAEVTATTGETEDRGLMVVVDWDNGTQSYFTPNNLTVVKG